MNMLTTPLQGRLTLLGTLLLFFSTISLAQEESNHGKLFEQLGPELRDPNVYRGMDGAPGPEYWQQRADYDITCTLDVEELRLDGSERITYFNQSPHTLRYLWLQLDENQHSDLADNHHDDPSRLGDTMSEMSLRMLEADIDRSKYGHKIHAVTDRAGKDLPYTVNQTMMRVDLPEPLKPGEEYTFHVDWHYYITDRMNPLMRGRGGYEYFEDEDNYIFTITQWFPRMCVYSDVEGWQNKQFTGRGEFALTFGNYLVKMTVPEDHVVGSTGECLNYPTVLTDTQLERWEAAKEAEEPLKIITREEALTNAARDLPKATKTWIYKADNVRDFAWTASPKFVWDAMPHFTEDGRRVMAMSYYPDEAYPIYSRYSTKVVAHTLDTYSKYTIPYPYPVAISVEASNGMEYPMICFNYGRAEEDGTYTDGAKYGAIGVIIHEVGHNYFPMIVNSDERQWTWMDEGINTFLQFLTEQEFDNNYPSRRGPPHLITGYMARAKNYLEPIMTNSENIVMFGANAYAKPATALNILRETVMGRELFDYAFKEYSRRWAFKHPTPDDFFRTMEDASAVDLDWFWRGWFFTTDAVDISLDSVKWFQVDLESNPEPREQTYEVRQEKPYEHLSKIRNREEGLEFSVEQDEDLVDFYTNYKPWETEDSVLSMSMELYAETFTPEEKEAQYGDKNYYQLYFSNQGGLVMPVILEWTYDDGTTEVERIPVEIWRKNEDKFAKVFVKDKVVTSVRLDPFRELADIDESNNQAPVPETPDSFQVYKRNQQAELPNPMQKAKGEVIKP